MKNTIIGGCFALLAAVLAVFVGHYLTKENIDIRYTLSDSIPANFLGKSSLSNIQQLDIVNRGDKPAEKIRIKLDSHITQYEITKYSAIDSVVENLSSKNLEIIYPELPPEGKIKIVFSSDLVPLNKNDVDIYHSKGAGKEAFDEKNSLFFSVGFFPVFYILLLVGFGTVESYSLRNKWLERDAHRGDEKILTRKKAPLFMSVERWYDLRKVAIENYIKKSSLRSYDIEGSKVVTSLNSEKPEYLKDYEWELLIKEAQDFFSDNIPSCFQLSFYYDRDIEKFFKLSKPKNVQQNKWDEILKKLHELYIFYLKEVALNTSRLEDAENIYKTLKNENTYNISEKLWGEYKNILKKIYYIYLVNGLCRKHEDFIAYINRHDLSNLDASDADFIKYIAYKFQKNTRFSYPFTLDSAQKFLKAAKEEWIEENDYKHIKSMAQDVVDFYAEKNRIKSIRNLLELIRFRKVFPEKKPSELTDEEWAELRNLEKDMVELLSENKEVLSKNNEILAKIEQKEKNIPDLIAKLNFQLSTINDFLSDPSVLDRLEDYNNTFSPGNFQNLKMISAHLKNINKA